MHYDPKNEHNMSTNNAVTSDSHILRRLVGKTEALQGQLPQLQVFSLIFLLHF